ncbi:MAG: hypothetical protein AB7O38_28720, partial [Pirellulaceae bacterium]
MWLLAAIVAGTGCTLPYHFGLIAPHPYVDETLRGELRTSGELLPNELVTQPATTLEQAPQEPVDRK